MNINDFQNLPREAQFKAAGAIAGIEPSVFDGIWHTESGRGANMLGPVTKSGDQAEGHFQLMPKTRATMEKRFGVSIDPLNFGQSLYTAAHLMKENMGRFKNLPDALRAYNGGWTPSTWGNAETAAYAGKVLGTGAGPTPTPAATAAPVATLPASAASMWNTPFAGAIAAPSMQGPSRLSKVADAVKAIIPALSAPVEAPTNKVFALTTDLAAAGTAKEAAALADATLGNMARAAAFHEPFNAVARWALRDDEPVDAAFVVPEDMLKDRTSNEQQDLRAATSEKQFNRMRLEQDLGREADSLAFKNGTAWGIGATLIAELPAAVLSGGLVTGLFKVGRVGSVALAAQGRSRAALASSAAEGILGNVATVALLDSIGERQGATAYGLAVGGGLLNPLIMGKSLGRLSDEANEALTATRLIEDAAANEAVLMAKARGRVGADASPEDVRAAMDSIEAEGIRAKIASHSEAVPESRKMYAGEVEDMADDVVEAAGAAPATATNNTLDDLRSSYGDKVAPRWEEPGFFQRRIDAMMMRGDWQAKASKLLNGEVDPLAIQALPAGVLVTKAAQATVTLQKMATLIKEIQAKYLPDDTVTIGNMPVTPKALGEVMTVGRVHMIGIKGGELPNSTKHTVLHELGHAIYHSHAPSAPPELMARLDAEYRTFVESASRGNPAAWEQRWAVTSQSRGANSPKPNEYNLSRDEYMAEQFVKHIQSKAMAGELGGKLSPGVIDQITQAVRDVIEYVRDLVNSGHIKPGKAADEFFSNILASGGSKVKATDEFLAPDLRLPSIGEATAANNVVPDKLAADVRAFLLNPIAIRHGLDRMPLGTPAQRAEAKQVLALYTKAESPEYVVDEARLSWLLKHVPSFSPTSNIMLRSKNPVVRMAALELLENGGGAGGRRSTAAIAKHTNERAIIGNAIVDIDRSFKTWFKTQPGASELKEGLSGAKRGEYSRLVAEEIEQRAKTGTQRDYGNAVRAGADAVEASFERARLMQVDAKTIGWQALPESSRGYLPHKIKSATYRDLNPMQKRALHSELTDQFIMGSGFDQSFSDQLASRYLDIVQHRALGGFDAPMGAHQVGASDVVREALEAMNLTRPELDAAMKRYAAGGAGHTKKRLNLDLSKEITLEDGSTFRLMDVYDTDVLSLIRGQSQRVSGEVALARHGVMGKPGLAIMRRAMGYGGADEMADRTAIDAFDQVSAEFLGSQFGVANKNVDRATQLNSLMSLGGMGINQFAEIINAGATLGVKAAFQNITGFGRLRAEILALADGKQVDNGLLKHIEQFGGAEFGTDAYKMVFPLDNPDLFANSLGADSLHWGDRLLRGGGHLQSKLSLWRTIHSVQVRGVAEQIVMKAARAMKDGVNDYHLRDMGMTDDVFARLKADMPNIMQYDAKGKLIGFDITAATDKEAANAFVQGVHRGAQQIIQGTFIGETGKYVHNSWLRMLSQFRTFSITAVDKQFNRQVGNRGVMGALFLTMGSMSVAAPIYMARTYLASVGRDDQKEYLEKYLSYGAIARATTNYIATSGLGGDFLDAFTAVTGTADATGGRSGTNSQFIGNMVAPVAGKVDKLWGAVQNTKGGTDIHGLLREMPLSRIPYFIPAINALGD